MYPKRLTPQLPKMTSIPSKELIHIVIEYPCWKERSSPFQVWGIQIRLVFVENIWASKITVKLRTCEYEDQWTWYENNKFVRLCRSPYCSSSIVASRRAAYRKLDPATKTREGASLRKGFEFFPPRSSRDHWLQRLNRSLQHAWENRWWTVASYELWFRTCSKWEVLKFMPSLLPSPRAFSF